MSAAFSSRTIPALPILQVAAGIIDRARAVRKPDWREAVDERHFLSPPAYHLLRKWHALEELPYLGQELAYIKDDPNLIYV